MKIKHLFFASILVISAGSITSCKKVYSCECVTKYTDDNNSTITLTKVESLDEKMKEDQAKASCKQTQTQMKVVNDDLNIDPYGTYYDITSTCEVK